MHVLRVDWGRVSTVIGVASVGGVMVAEDGHHGN